MYVDGFVFPLPLKNLTAYKKMASLGAKIWMEHGALQYIETIGDDLTPDMEGMKVARFPILAKAKKGETVVFSLIIYKSRRHRDAVNKKVMADKRMAAMPKKIPFDMTKMAFGGFKSIVSK